VYDTIFELTKLGEEQKANDFRNEFKLPPKRYYWIKIKAYATSGRWKQLREFSDQERSPIGYGPFAECCILHGNQEEAPYYIEKMARGEPEKQVILWGMIKEWQKALDAAAKLKNRNEVLFTLRVLCSEPGVIEIIDGYLRE